MKKLIEQYLSRYYRQSVEMGPLCSVTRITPQPEYRPVIKVQMDYKRQSVKYHHPLPFMPTQVDEAWVVYCYATVRGERELFHYTYCAEGALDVVLNVAYLKTVEAVLKQSAARQQMRRPSTLS